MSKQWYYEVMGSTVGPLTSAELRQGVLSGKIQPDTPVRLGTDGKWQSADRIKGLLDAPTAPSSVPPASQKGTAATTSPPPVAPAAAALTASTDAPRMSLAAGDSDDATYHFSGESADHAAGHDPPPTEYDFFRFVGFEQALGTALHAVLCEYCHVHHLTMTQATRRAIAELVQRKDLSGEQTAGAPPVAAEAAPAATAPAGAASA